MLRQRKAKEKNKCTEDEQKRSDCIICLDEVSCRGKLSVCDHWFCFHCIFEWSKNTNTCPVCKARFRCITKTHVNALKSPPHKLRVKDVDQRVWNEDDSVVAEDYDDYSEDDFDDDYEPSHHVANPWTRQNSQSVQRAQLDEYDLDDTFIANDEDEDDDDGDEDEDSDSDSTDSDDEHVDEPITKPYSLRSNGPALTISLPDSDDSSSTSTGSFIASEDDDLDDSDTAQWMIPGQSTQSPRRRNKSQHHRVDKKPTKGSTSQTINTARKMLRSQRTVSTAAVSTTSKRKAKDCYTSDEEDQTDGWINMTQRRENMRAVRSRHSPRRQSRRGKSARKAGQRSVRQKSSDSEGTDGDLLCNRNNSCRPKRTSRNENPKNSSSNLRLTRSEKQMSKQQTFATGAALSDGLWESDSEEFLPSKTSSKGKGKGKGKCLDKGNSGEHYSRVTNEPMVIISSDENESDPLTSMPSTSRGKSKQAHTIMVAESSKRRLIRGTASWGDVSDTGPQGEQDSGSDDSLPRCNVTIRKRRNDTNKTKIESSTAVVMGWNKENLGCSTSEHGRNRCKTSYLTGEENCISPTPPSRRYYSIFTKRRHRPPCKTFDSCGDDVDAGALSYKSTKLKIASKKLPENVNNVPTKHNAHTRVELGNSPTVQVKRKRRRLLDLDSD